MPSYHNSIAKQLHDSKIQLETQIRAELESEYRTTNPQIMKNGSNVTELENQLRQQLQQVTDERKRWQFDQEDFRIINTNPKSVAKRTHYYSVEHNGEKLSGLEDTWHPGPYSLPSG